MELTKQEEFALKILDQYQIEKNSIVFDIGSNFASNTFTAPVTGKYQLNMLLRLHDYDQSFDYLHLRIVTSNRNYKMLREPVPFDDEISMLSWGTSVLADMDAGDTAYIAIYQQGGSAILDVSGSDGQFSWFTGHLVC